MQRRRDVKSVYRTCEVWHLYLCCCPVCARYSPQVAVKKQHRGAFAKGVEDNVKGHLHVSRMRPLRYSWVLLLLMHSRWSGGAKLDDTSVWRGDAFEITCARGFGIHGSIAALNIQTSQHRKLNGNSISAPLPHEWSSMVNATQM